MHEKNGFGSSLKSSAMALLAAGALAAVFVIAPVSMTGQAPPPAGKGGGFGGGGGGKQAPQPVPFPGPRKANLTCPAFGAAYSRVALPASSRKSGAAEAVAGVRADLPEAVLVEREAELVVPAVAVQGARQQLVDPVVRALPVDAVPEVSAALPARTLSSIPRMAKFPTRRQLARNPTS